jgi:uncharacterized protein YjbJ (UPF0337 family)
MNKTIMQGKWRRVRGDLKMRWGKLTDDDRRLLDGKIDQMVGLFQERYGYTQERAAHALKHYLGGYGKSSRRHAAGPAQSWRPVAAMVGLFSLMIAGWFALARLLSYRREVARSEYADQEPFVSPEVQFD